jgi:hypothetical protein
MHTVSDRAKEADMSEYRSQVDGRRMPREVAANPPRVRAVPLSEAAAFERAMVQLGGGPAEARKFHPHEARDQDFAPDSELPLEELDEALFSEEPVEGLDMSGHVVVHSHAAPPFGERHGGRGGHDPHELALNAAEFEPGGGLAQDEPTRETEEAQADTVLAEQADLFDLALELAEVLHTAPAAPRGPAGADDPLARRGRERGFDLELLGLQQPAALPLSTLAGWADHETSRPADATFALLERVSGASHHFEVVSSTSPVRSIELIQHPDGQTTANVVVTQNHAAGLAEVLDRLRLRMGRLGVSLLRLMVEERIVAELRPDRVVLS